MEKITKEELLNKLGNHALEDDELTTVAGGFDKECDARVASNYLACILENDLDYCKQIRCEELAACGNSDAANCGN